MKCLFLCILCFAFGSLGLRGSSPNLIIILADDMGYSDIGCYGSEIQTPHLDQLAEEGVRFSRFYNASRCCPTRASLLTGLYPHQTGVGGMTDIDVPIPEYQGYLNEHCVTLAEVLNSAGYKSYLAGKWHVGDEAPYWPAKRGFDRCYSLIKGAASFFDFLPYRNELWPPGNAVLLVEDDQPIPGPGEPFYATDLYTDKAIEFIREHPADQPFFLFLAYTAPHWPLHALPEDMERYTTTYAEGWDAIRRARLAKQNALGLHPEESPMTPRDESVPAWAALTDKERELEEKRMIAYAAMVDRMDQNIGRLRDALETLGYAENTVIFFLSDNGAARAGQMVGWKYLADRFDPEADPGAPLSFTGYGRGWANVSNTPFREFKSYIHEGGIATPFIAWYPGHFPANTIRRQSGHVIDIMPTLCALSGAEYPVWYNGHTIQPYVGTSLLPAIQEDWDSEPRTVYFEHLGKRGLIRGAWKLVALRDRPWELYDLRKDRLEQEDQSQLYPNHLKRLVEAYEAWAYRQRVLPYDEVEAVSPYRF